jgi:hypothetical protein
MNWLEKRTLQEAFEKMDDQTKFNFLLWKLMCLENEKIEAINPPNLHCQSCNNYHKNNHIDLRFMPDLPRAHVSSDYWVRYRGEIK